MSLLLRSVAPVLAILFECAPFVCAQPAPIADFHQHNDWTSSQVAMFPDRLIGFCSVNPLRSYAIPEIERCSRDPHLRDGVKLHFGNSQIDYHNADDISRVRAVFQAANAHHMAIVVHMRASVTRGWAYGADEARVFLTELLPAAPDVVVQIAHLSGAGGYDPATDHALGVFIDAIARHESSMKNVWFDVTSVAQPSMSAEQRALIASRIRQIGVERILYGSDAPVGTNLRPKEGWQAFRALPLTDAEFDTIAANVPPYLP